MLRIRKLGIALETRNIRLNYNGLAASHARVSNCGLLECPPRTVFVEELLATCRQKAVGVDVGKAVPFKRLRDGDSQSVEVDTPRRLNLCHHPESGRPGGGQKPLAMDVQFRNTLVVVFGRSLSRSFKKKP